MEVVVNLSQSSKAITVRAWPPGGDRIPGIILGMELEHFTTRSYQLTADEARALAHALLQAADVLAPPTVYKVPASPLADPAHGDPLTDDARITMPRPATKAVHSESVHAEFRSNRT